MKNTNYKTPQIKAIIIEPSTALLAGSPKELNNNPVDNFDEYGEDHEI